MKITREFIMRNRTANGGFTGAQIKALGFPVFGCSGWIDMACNREYTQEEVDNFVKGKEVYVPFKKSQLKELKKLKKRLVGYIDQEEKIRQAKKTVEAMIEEIERNEQMKGVLK